MKKLLLSIFLGSLTTIAFAQNEYPPLRVPVHMDSDLIELIDHMQSYAKENRVIKGFRVQIYNGRKDECLAQRAKFLKNHPQVDAYLLYQSPEFRTQVGDFRTRLEAEAFLRKIIANFPGSFVVKTEVNYPQSKAK